ncbi:MAG: glycosyltransferase family 2 protein [Flavobacteriales bacterium]|nr:glycosyltransferase family 2 protein [Flavobacteriales bacterium]
MKLSIIIVHYRVKKLLEECLTSILANKTSFDYEIIVIDNDSNDNSQNYITSQFPTVNWIQNKENIGFSKANNKASEIANGEFILFLNPDTLLPNTILQEIIDFAEKQKKIGCLGVRMTNKNGIFHQESKRNIPNPYNTFKKLYTTILRKNVPPTKGYYFTELDEFSVGKVPILTGAFLLMKKEDFYKVGEFDSNYFMYGEDIDLCYSFIRNGYTNFYYGKQTIIHYKGESTLKDKTYYKNFFKAMEIFVRKYYSHKNIFIYLLLQLGLKVRYWIALLLYYLKK